jgi:hypothetical protein
MSKLTPKVILEGIRLTHKTDVEFALNEHARLATWLEQKGAMWAPAGSIPT